MPLAARQILFRLAVQKLKEKSREEQRAIREQIREEERAKKEIEKAIKQADSALIDDDLHYNTYEGDDEVVYHQHDD